MPALSGFTAFWLLSREKRMSGADKMINDGTLQNYTGSDMMLAAGKARTFNGGKSITDFVNLSAKGNFGSYGSGDRRNPTPQNNSYQVTYQHRFYENSTTITEAEELLNDDADEFDVWKRIGAAKDQELETPHWNGLEATLWATPDPLMETAPAKKDAPAYSVPAFITTDGLIPSQFTGSATTIGGVNPSTVTAWRNVVKTYDGTDAGNVQEGLFSAFMKAMLAAQFKVPQGGGKVFTPDQFMIMIFTDLLGVVKYSNLLRASRDQFAKEQDAALMAPEFYGKLIRYVAALDGKFTVGQEMYYLVNPQFLFPVYHPKMFKRPRVAEGGIEQPDAKAMYLRSWFNNTCWSRRRQALVKAA